MAACLFVVYSHVIAGRAEHYEYEFLPYAAIRDYVLDPLGIIQNSGFFGVALFFVISGFIITHTAQRESRVSFVVKRVARIHPPLVAAVAGALSLYIPVFAMGMVIYFVYRGAMTVRMGALLCAAAWVAMVYNLRLLHPALLKPPTLYSAQVAYVVTVFIGGLLAWRASIAIRVG